MLVNITLGDTWKYRLPWICDPSCDCVNHGPKLCLKRRLDVGLKGPSPIALSLLQKQRIHRLTLTSLERASRGRRKERERARIDTAGKADDSSNVGPEDPGPQ